MEKAPQLSALDRATPTRLWTWAVIIAIAGAAARVIWFLQFQHDLPNGYLEAFSPHYWGIDGLIVFEDGVGGLAGTAQQDLARAFAPAYGLTLKTIVELGGGIEASKETIGWILLGIQTVCVALATLLTFALSRRVLFGWVALVPAILLNLSIALIELPGGVAWGVPTMLAVVLAVWITVVLKEHIAHEDTGPRDSKALLLTIAAGFTLGGAVLFSPAVLLAAIPILWWSFRGLGRDYATLFVVAAILLPASWLAVVKAETVNGIPIGAARDYIQQDSGNIPAGLGMAVDRGYAVATTWNPRFARGDFASENWNYEWVLPQSIRSDTTYITATRVLFAFFIVAYVLLTLIGLLELFAEGAGSAARLIAIPAVMLPFATFFSAGGNIMRLPALPLIAIALTLGSVWISENLRSRRPG